MSEYFINAFKTTLACFLGFLLARILKLESKQWLIITILVVMTAQTNIGGVLQKSYWRFLGTILGALIAVLTVIFFKENTLVLNSVVILSAFVFSYWAACSPEIGQALALGAVTVSIVLLVPQPGLHYALLRLAEIFSGIVIALLVNILVFPISATKKLKKLLAENLDISQAYYKIIIDRDSKKSDYFEKIMMHNFLVAQKLLDESKAEYRSNKKYFLDILFHEKRLFRAISLLEPFLVKKPEHKEKLEQEYLLITEVLKKLSLEILENKKIDLSLIENQLKNIQHKNKIFFIHFIFEEIELLIKIIK